MTVVQSRPVVSILRICDPATAAWNDVARRRLAKHTCEPHEVIESVIDASFGAAANRAAVKAQAEHIVLMRGDTLVRSGWLEPLLSTASRDDPVVAPCVAGLDGSLLDAGFMATAAGDLIALGCGDAHADPFWSFVRELSSPSPACFMVARRVFLAAGGFDCSIAGDPLAETADLAFKLRTRGHRVLLQPESTVYCADAANRTTRFRMDRAFRERWAPALTALPSFDGSQTTRTLVDVRDAGASSRLLIIDDRVPHADRGGGDPRMHRILNELARLWPALHITFFAMRPDNGAVYGRSLRQAGIEVVYGVGLDEWLSSRRAVFDVVMISRPRAALPQVRATQPQARIVYDMEAIHFRRQQRTIPLAPLDDARAAARAGSDLLQLEVGLIAEADAVLCVSEEDRAFAGSIAPGTPALLVSHASVPPQSVPSFDERRNLVFFGAFWRPGSPNEDAALYLVRRVMPVIWHEDPSIRLVIIGADPTPEVQNLEGPQVTVLGYVSDPGTVLSRARVHVMPIRAGAGIKLRLIESMAAGLPFVTTTVGAEGLPLGMLRPAVVADTPVDIARRALALYHDRHIWTAVQRTLSDIAATHYSAAVLRQQLIDAMATVGIVPPPSQSTISTTT